MDFRRRLQFTATIGLFGFAVLWLAIGALRLADARTSALIALGELEVLEDSVELATILETDARVTTVSRLEAARVEFAQAGNELSGFWTWPYRVLPWVGTQVTSARALSESADTVALVLSSALRDVGPYLEGEVGLGELGPAVSTVSESLTAAADTLESVDLGPERGLIGSLASARERFAASLAAIEDLVGRAAVVSAGVDDFLRGPTDYVILAANNAEMRAGSGMLLMAGPLEVDQGRFGVGQLRSTAEILVEPGLVQIADPDFEQNWGYLLPQIEWRNLATTPRFDVTADQAVRMWAAVSGVAADGVILVDVVALEALLEVVGPVRVGSKTISADNVVDEVTYEQYEEWRREERQDGLREIAGAVVLKLLTGGSDIRALLEAFSSAAEGRHIMMWSLHDRQQAAWSSLGLDGTLGSNSVMLSVLNRGTNKLDPFLNIRAILSSEPVGDRVAVNVDVRLNNTATGDEYGYVISLPDDSELPEGSYQGIVALSLPASAEDVSYEGGKREIAKGPDGPESQVVAVWVEIRPGGRNQLTFTFSLPAEEAALLIEPSARIPATRWTNGDRNWRDERRRAIELAAS